MPFDSFVREYDAGDDTTVPLGLWILFLFVVAVAAERMLHLPLFTKALALRDKANAIKMATPTDRTPLLDVFRLSMIVFPFIFPEVYNIVVLSSPGVMSS